MIKALHFNYSDDNTEIREITTDFKPVDEFWIKTSSGPLMPAEVWKDTEKNREIISLICDEKNKLKEYKNQMAARVYKLVHTKEK